MQTKVIKKKGLLIFLYFYMDRQTPLNPSNCMSHSTDEKLYLLDAYALIYRAYYAFMKSPRMNSKGENTSAVFGFLNTLEDLIRKHNPSHLAVVFDPQGPTFRHLAYEPYKAQREKTPEVISWSVPWIKKLLQAYQIPILVVDGFEADDVLGTIATLASKESLTTYIVSPDKDLGQVIDSHIFQFKPKFGSNEFEVFGPKEVTEKYGLKSPLQMIDYLGLVGDSSDNIPGCPGVGAVTAKKLLDQFDNIETLLENTDQLSGSVKTKVENNKDLLVMSKFLATIRLDVPIAFDKESLKRIEPNESELMELYQRLELRGHLQKIISKNSEKENSQKEQEKKIHKKTSIANNGQTSIWDVEDTTIVVPQKIEDPNAFENPTFPTDGQDASEFSNLRDIHSVDHKYYLIESEDEFNDFYGQILDQKIFAFDTETNHIEAIHADLVGISFCWENQKAFYLQIFNNPNKANFLSKIKTLLENPLTTKIGQNLKYDMMVLRHLGIQVKGPLFDTMVAHYLIQPELRHNMDFLAEVYLKYKPVSIESILGSKGKNQKNMQDLTAAQIYEYAAEDADITWQLKTVIEKELVDQKLDDLFHQVEMPLVHVLLEMEYAGVGLDLDSLKQSSLILNRSLQLLEQNIQAESGINFNVNSPKQIGEVLFDHLKIDQKAKKTKTGQYVTSEDVLEKLKSKHVVVDLILQQRGLKKLLSTYIDALPALIHPVTNKIHTSFNQTVTSTGRLSSSNPNLQNIPIREELGREIRKAFTADEGTVFLSADYSQIELRIMAHLSQDQTMIEAFKMNADIHAITASKIYKIPLEEVTSDMRRKAKTANFGIIYGISTFGLAERMNVSRTEAKELIDGYFQTYPNVKKYMEQCIEVAKEKGWVETLFHRKRYLQDIYSQNANVRSYAERNAINAPIQGTAADIIKKAMIDIQKEIEAESLSTKMILQVHDELNFIVPVDEVEKVKDLVIRNMENAVKLDVPLKVDLDYGKNWLEAHS